MKVYYFSIILAFSAGMLGAIQGSTNAHIGKDSGQLAMIIGVSLIQVIAASAILMRNGWSSFLSISSPWMLVSGILGVIMMFSVSSSINTLGTLPVFLLIISGQIISSALIDHFGLFNSSNPLTLQKIGSILVIVTGVILFVKTS